jgi:predicted nucleotidyltransferase
VLVSVLTFDVFEFSCRLYLPVGTQGGNEYSGDMVSDRDKATIAALARRYGAATVWLFGSSADRRRRGRDLDLAVEGVASARFFQFVGDLMLSLSRPVDVVALEKRSKLSALIRRDGILIYGQPAREG